MTQNILKKKGEQEKKYLHELIQHTTETCGITKDLKQLMNIYPL